MKKQFLAVSLLVCSSMLPVSVQAANPQAIGMTAETPPVSGAQSVPVAAQDAVDWGRGMVTGTGMGMAPPTAINLTQAQLLARRAAVVDGYRQLAEAIQGVRVDAESTVENMMLQSDVIKTKVSACIKGAQVIEERMLPNGMCEVRMAVSMYGVSNPLAGAVMPRPQRVVPFPAMAPAVPPAMPAPSSLSISVNININAPQAGAVYTSYASNISPGTYGGFPAQDWSKPLALTNLAAQDYPTRYENMVPYTGMADPAPSAVYEQKAEEKRQKDSALGGFTSLVVDCTGLGLKPAMSPVIRNEAGEAIYGAENLDYDIVTTKGMVAYAKDPDLKNVSRIGNKPLIVKCVSLEGNNVNPIISVADANRVLLENEQTKFLHDLNVVFVR